MAGFDRILNHLTFTRDEARDQYFAFHNPGNLTPAQKHAFQFREMAYLLLLNAAQMELDAEMKLRALLSQENALHE